MTTVLEMGYVPLVTRDNATLRQVPLRDLEPVGSRAFASPSCRVCTEMRLPGVSRGRHLYMM